MWFLFLCECVEHEQIRQKLHVFNKRLCSNTTYTPNAMCVVDLGPPLWVQIKIRLKRMKNQTIIFAIFNFHSFHADPDLAPYITSVVMRSPKCVHKLDLLSHKIQIKFEDLFIIFSRSWIMDRILLHDGFGLHLLFMSSTRHRPKRDPD